MPAARELPAAHKEHKNVIVGYHIIFGMYGFWLPNDPRGSWSQFVGSRELYRVGPATKTTERRSLAHRQHNLTQRLEAKKKLQHPSVVLTGIQARAVGRGFARYFSRSGVAAWACAILSDHVHLVVGCGRYEVEKMVIGLKSRATAALKKEGIHPHNALRQRTGSVPKCFARGAWKVYLDPEDLDRAIRYVEKNPVKEGLPRQRWSFVTRVDDVLRSAPHSRRG